MWVQSNYICLYHFAGLSKASLAGLTIGCIIVAIIVFIGAYTIYR